MSITERIEKFRQSYVNTKPQLSCERAKIYTDSYRETEGEPMCIRSAKAYLAACEKLPVTIFDDEIIVGTAGEFKRTGILTPEFSWKWVDKGNDN